MAIQIQLRSGTTTEHNTFTGAVGELTYDTELDRLKVHNGTTVGGKVIVGTRLVSTFIDANIENTTGVRIVNELGNTNLPFNTRGVLSVYSNEIFVAGALRVYQTFQPDTFNDLFFRKWDGVVWSAWERSVKFSEKNTEAFGFGQSPINVTSERSTGTTYTNTTGKTIFVSITTQGTEGTDNHRLYVDGVLFAYANNISVNDYVTLQAPIPSGSTYQLTIGAGNLRNWVELR